MNKRVMICEDISMVSKAVSEIILSIGSDHKPASLTCGVRRMMTLALAGGSTPKYIYHQLVAEHAELLKARQDDLDAEDVEAYGPEFLYSHILFGDERCVSPDSERSNFRLARDELLNPLSFPSEQVHRIHGEAQDPAEAASDYESTIHHTFASIWEMQFRIQSVLEPEGSSHQLKPDPDEWERFDLILLGMGTDGHTASLFPGSSALDEKIKWVVATEQPETGEKRITMTLPCLNRARMVVFTICGEEKAEMVRRLIEPACGEEPIPASLVCPENGEIIYVLDRAASSKLAMSYQ
ncbi:MAG: 6-phosphogluconolactonase [Planctomycetes bacterium]|nr:6-phosphogluconolactonase [Planctomycetota bacterium]